MLCPYNAIERTGKNACPTERCLTKSAIANTQLTEESNQENGKNGTLAVWQAIFGPRDCGFSVAVQPIRYTDCFLSRARCRLDIQSDLLTKIERLQRDMFWMKCIAAVLFLCLTAACLIAWFGHPKTVEAAEFLVRGRQGNVVARLGQLNFGDTCLTLTANQNVSVANLCVQNDEGTYLDLHNLKSESRATLTPGFSICEPL